MNTLDYVASTRRAGVETGTLQVAIIGSGKIGADLLAKALRSPKLDCAIFVGRNPESEGLRNARNLGVTTSADGHDAIRSSADDWDVLLDATSAADHAALWPHVERFGKPVIDLTPSKIGAMCIPVLNLDDCVDAQNVNLVTCGGQAAVPVAAAMTLGQTTARHIDVISTVAASSIGPATIANIDAYYATTELALVTHTACEQAAIDLVIDTSITPQPMRTTISVELDRADVDLARANVSTVEQAVRHYAPGYRVVEPPFWSRGAMHAVVEVTGSGDSLPPYAGNLDIITSAAIAIAESYATQGPEAQSKA